MKRSKKQAWCNYSLFLTQRTLLAGAYGAITLYPSRKGHKDANEEVTEKQLERDIKALVHGKADGEIIIKNEKPQLGGGLHEVIDHVHKGKTAFKETIEASEEEKN